jgi:hypothetical protein
MTIQQKINRIIVFLAALRHTQVTKHLARHGLTPEIVEHGWNLVQRLSPRRASEPVNSEDIEALDVWEDYWFPIISAVLAAHYPDVHRRIFSDLSRGTGVELIVSVRALLERLDEEAAANGGQAMRQLLVSRGLTDEVVAEARQLLAGLTTMGATVELNPELSAAEREAAADAMWKFYLEWSAIARVAITDRKVLRLLGFLKPNRRASTEGPEEDSTVPVVP